MSSELRPLIYRTRRLSRAQMLRKLQLAVDHIAAVIETDPGALAELSQALDLIHQAEGEIERGE